MTQRAVLELEVLELFVEGLMLTDLTHVILLHDDAHATGNAGGEMCSAVLAINIKFIDRLATLGALGLDLALVDRRMSREKVDSQELIGFSLGLVDGV